jgi:PST family polysaccharide transporter
MKLPKLFGKKLTGDSKAAAYNAASLALFQFANYIFPLATIPFLTRVLGPYNYGLTIFVTVLIGYAITFSDYGFNLSATRLIAINKSNDKYVSEIFCSVTIIKFSIFFICAIPIFFIIMVQSQYSTEAALLLAAYVGGLGQILTPIWLFQGLEVMRPVIYIQLASKLLSCVFIFTLVDDPKDYLLVVAINSSFFLLGGFLCLLKAKKIASLRLYIPATQTLIFYLKDGFSIFFSNVSISLYTTSANFVIGMALGPAALAQFSAADKIVQLLKTSYLPVVQAGYPLVSRRVRTSKNDGIKLAWKFGVACSCMSFFLGLLCFVYADDLVKFVFGDGFADAASLLKIMAFVPVFTCLSYVLGILVMLNLEFRKEFTVILAASGLLGLSFVILSVNTVGLQGVSWSVFVAELIVTASMSAFLFCKRRTGAQL